MKRFFLLFFLFILLIGGVSYLFVGGNEKVLDHKVVEVKRCDFDLILQQRGELEASKYVKIKSKIPSNRAKIVEMVKEGEYVTKGRIIARFDIKPFMEKMDKWRYKIEEAKSSLIKAKKELEIFKNSSVEEIEKIKKSIELAKLKLNDVKFGSGKMKLDEYDKKIKETKRKLKLLKAKLDDFNELFSKGYISKRELDEVNDSYLSKKDELGSLKQKEENFKNYELKKMVKEMELKLSELKKSLENKKIKNRLLLESKKGAIKKAQSYLNYCKDEYEKAKENVLKCEIKAPINGVVIYEKIPKNGKRAKVEIGDSIWHNQSFMMIPDTDNMVAVTYVRELDLNRVKKGMKVKIVLDAYPKKEFSGVVKEIGFLAKSYKDEKNVKFFKVKIEMLQKDKILRSGMSATIFFNYESVKDAICLPVDALFYDEKGSFVKFLDGKKSYVKVGRVGVRELEILSGVGIGAKVVSK